MTRMAAASGPSATSHAGSSAGALHRLNMDPRVRSPQFAHFNASKARKLVAQTQQRIFHKVDSGYGTMHDLLSARPIDSPAKIAEKERMMEIAREVNVGTTHFRGTEHLIGLVRAQELPELNKSNSDMKKYHELTPGGIEAPLAIHNVGGNPLYPRSDVVIERAMLPRILTGIAIMVIVPRLRLTTLCCC